MQFNKHKLSSGGCRFDSDREDGDVPRDDPLLVMSSEKDRFREDPKISRERARIAARWAALHPVDDLEVSMALADLLGLLIHSALYCKLYGDVIESA